MKLDNSKQESSNQKVIGVGPKDSESKNDALTLECMKGSVRPFTVFRLA